MNTFLKTHSAVNRFFSVLALLAIVSGSFPGIAQAVDVETVPPVSQPISGCMDVAATNYNPLATVSDNSCQYPVVLGCTDLVALNYNPLATQDDASCIPPAPAEYCMDDSALNYDEEGECIYDDGREVLTACKYNANEEAIEDWGMTITNDREGEANVTFSELSTEEDGCVSVLVYPEDGPFYVTEENRSGWMQQSVNVTNGQVNESEGADYCEFFAEELISNFDQVVVTNEYNCSFVNVPEAPQCVDTQSTGATSVVSSAQAKKNNGDNITDANRVIPTAALGLSDWSNGGSTGFFSLGFGGSITLEFNQFVNEVSGTDLSIHEATNGSSYPVESAVVEVSQNGAVWYQINSASNPAPERITELDFSSTGLSWIKFVRLTDSSDGSIHDADADGFDLDAIIATKTTCNQPKDVTPAGACEIEGHKYDNKGNPLEGWFIGLKKVVTYGEVEEEYTILDDTTDKAGYYCLEWDNVDFSEVESGYDSFLYRIYERLQEGWRFLSIEEGADYDNLSVVAEDDVWYGENEVGTQFGEVNGYVIANAAHHVDFYNTNDNPRFTLNVAITGEGDGDVDSTDLLINCSSQGEVVDCNETYASGTVVSINVVPAEGSNFDESWTSGFGTCVGNAASCQIVMTQDVNLVAHFGLNDSSNNRGGSGRRSSNPSPTPTVAGITDSQVLGDQVSIVPFGAAGTGRGGASNSNSLFEMTVAFIALSTLMVFGLSTKYNN